jgi:malonyl-CoA O-methyltransferase
MGILPTHHASGDHATSVRSRFSAEAPGYDGYATVQKRVAERLVHHITTSPKLVLEIGCGSGQLTALLLAALPDAHIDAIDVSPPMIMEANRKTPHNVRLKWHVADFLSFSSEHEFDLIASASALHWIHPIESVFERIRRLLAPDGRFIFAIMVDGTLRELRDARLRVAPGKPPLGKLPRGAEVRQAATQTGFEIIECSEDRLLESFDSSAAFLHAIHRLGVTGGDVSRSRNPLTRGEIIRLIEDYDAHYGDRNGRVVATYDVLYMHARQAAAR